MRPFAFMRRKPRARGLILLYHRIAESNVDPWNLCVSPRNFADHLTVLKKFQPASLSDLAGAGRRQSVAVTFDDGYADNLHCAAKLLEQHDTPATFFLTSGYIGARREFWWDELERRLADHTESRTQSSGAQARNRTYATAVACAGRIDLTIGHQDFAWNLSSSADWRQAWLPAYLEIYNLLQPLEDAERRVILQQIAAGSFDSPRASHRALDRTEVARLARNELFEIGAHTVTHPRLSAHAPAKQFAEMNDSRQSLEAIVGRPIKSFSYPYGGRGHYSRDSVQMARTAGFSLACTTTPAPVEARSNAFELPRIVIENIDGDRFEQLLNTWLNKKN